MSLAQLHRLRWAVRGVLVLGVAASITANVLHAEPNTVSQVIAGWPPLALLITIELVARVPVHRTWLANIRRLATTGIAGIAAWVSYWHMAGVASRYGEHGASPFLLPLSVDGLVVIASVSLVELAGRIRDEAPEPVAEQPAKQSEPGAVGTQDEAQPKLTPAAEKIARVRRRQPSLTQQEAAQRAGVHINTVKSWWAYTAPTAPATDQAPINGAVPESITN
jgi:hypothetical protein